MGKGVTAPREPSPPSSDASSAGTSASRPWGVRQERARPGVLAPGGEPAPPPAPALLLWGGGRAVEGVVDFFQRPPGGGVVEVNADAAGRPRVHTPAPPADLDLHA